MFFQEHDIGVWVSRVVPTGNGAMKGIQHGDQLAAINGSSSLHVTIEEVAQQISDGATDSVELTFLRYVGPMCPIPCVNKEEGFEISDSAVLPSIKQKTTEESPKSVERHRPRAFTWMNLRKANEVDRLRMASVSSRLLVTMQHRKKS